MRTTLDIDKALLEEAARIAGSKSLSMAVNEALAEYVRRRKIEGLRALRGRVRLALSWQEMERLEMAEEDHA
jgi:Arc/MetJ family transcription regulator